MNKYNVLGVVLMASIILLIVGSHDLGLTSVQFMSASFGNFAHGLGLILVVLFGSFASLTVGKLK